MTAVGRARKRALVLFPDAWDHRAQANGELSRDYRFEVAGFDLFRSPENARLIWFDAERFLDRLFRRWRRGGLDLVVSSHELWGAALAAELASRLGLPGHPPQAVLAAQHKLVCRELLAARLPQATPRFAAFSYPLAGPESIPLPFPLLVKPVKATFSILARRVESYAELAAHLKFGRFEEWLLRRLVAPFEQLCSARLQPSASAFDFLAEEVAPGLLVNVDGFVAAGTPRVVGLADGVLHPGTLAFERFEVPSRLPAELAERAATLACQVVEALGLTQGCFNVELLCEPVSGRLTVVEVNPRLAYQLADLYSRVYGWDLHRLELALAAGETPRLEPRVSANAVAASFVCRRFDGLPVERWPGRARLAALAETDPDALILLYRRRGAALRREMKWLGSYRYAIVNLGGRDHQQLLQRWLSLAAELGLTPPATVPSLAKTVHPSREAN